MKARRLQGGLWTFYVTSYTTSDNVRVCEYITFNSKHKVYAVNHTDGAIPSCK